MLVVQIHTLASTDAFIVFDLEGAPGAGIVRSAPKILVDGATALARSLTYRFATFERRIGGASAGINAKPDVRPAAVAAFATEATDLVGAGRLLVEAGRGVSPDDLVGVTAVDPRPETYWSRHDELTALGVAVAAEAALGDLAGCSVAIEGFDATGPLLAAELVARGARVTAVATSEGTTAAATGLDVPALALAWAAHGPACVRELELETGAPGAVFGAPADVLVAGSKPGVVDDEVAAGLEVRAVVPGGPGPGHRQGAGRAAPGRHAGPAGLRDHGRPALRRVAGRPCRRSGDGGCRCRSRASGPGGRRPRGRAAARCLLPGRGVPGQLARRAALRPAVGLILRPAGLLGHYGWELGHRTAPRGEWPRRPGAIYAARP